MKEVIYTSWEDDEASEGMDLWEQAFEQGYEDADGFSEDPDLDWEAS